MFYGSPFPPSSQPGGGQPTPGRSGPTPSPLSGGIPPAGFAAAPKPPEEVAFAEARAALKGECADNVPVLMGETKKMCVAIVEAGELMLTARHRRLELNPAAVLRQELQNQVMAYALMRFLPDDTWKAAAERSGSLLAAGLAENPPVGKAGVFVRELESQVKDTPRNQEHIKQWLLTQPLFRALNNKPEAFAKLEAHFEECGPKMNQLIQSTNESLSNLLHQQSSLRPGLSQF